MSIAGPRFLKSEGVELMIRGGVERLRALPGVVNASESVLRGIRLALGAQMLQVKNMVVFQGMRLALVGVVIGVAAAFGLARFMSAFVLGAGTRDPLVFVGVPVLLTGVAFLAVWLPARRASRVDPIVALRYE
jgi:ABC-type antimicrobial peptide transport system permease subunit